MPLTYRQVKDLHDTLAAAGVTSKSLPEWAGEMNALTETDLYDQGLHDNVLKRASVGIDRALESVPGLIPAAESLGGGVGGMFGMESQGRSIGKTLPRMAVDFAPVMATGGFGGLIAGAGALGTGLLSGANAYTATGSPAAGVISGGLNAVLPTGVGAIEQGALSFLRNRGIAKGVEESLLPRLVSGPLAKGVTESGDPAGVSQVSRLFPRTFGQSAAATTAGQLGAAGIMGGSEIAQEAFSGEPVKNPFTPEFALNLALGQLPFSAMHLGSKIAGLAGGTPMEHADTLEAAITKTNQLLTLKKAKEDLAAQTDLEKIPELPEEARQTTKKVQAEIDDRLQKIGALREQQNAITSKPNMTPDDAEQLGKLVTEDLKESGKSPATQTSVLGSEQSPTADKIGLIGRTIGETTKSRTILVADDPSNPEEFRGRVVNYSKGKFETAPTDTAVKGMQAFGVPRDWHTVLSVREQTAPVGSRVKPDGTPELPDQLTPAAPLFDYATIFDKVIQDVETAQTPAQVAKALVNLRAIQESNNLVEFTDKQLARVAKKLADQGSKDPVKDAIKARTTRDKKLLAVQEERTAAVAEAEGWRSELEKEFVKGEAGDPNIVPLMRGFHAIEDATATRGSRGSRLADSGELTRMFYALRSHIGVLDNADVLDRLKNQINERIRTGAGLTKSRTPVTDEIKAKLDNTPDTVPVKNLIAENAVKALQSPEAKTAYDTWPGKDTNPFDHEKATFAEWVIEFGNVDPEDIPEFAELQAEKTGLDVIDLKSELEDFVNRPHVKIWRDIAEANVAKVKSENEQGPSSLAPRELGDVKQLPAGGPFVWNLAPLSPYGMRLGDRHTLPRSGEVTEAQLKAIGGRGKPLQDVEMDMMRELDGAVKGGAFDGKGNVNVRKLVQVLKDNPVMVESHTYGMEGKVSLERSEYDSMTHEWYDTLSTGIKNDVLLILAGREAPGISAKQKTLALKYKDLREKIKDEPLLGEGPRATSYYSQISPFDTKKFPVIRIDVAILSKNVDWKIIQKDGKVFLRIPRGEDVGPFDNEQQAKAWQDREKHNESLKTPELWSPDNLHENLPNTLGWAMAQVVPGKDGEPVMFVGEQQSRWGQTVQKEKGDVRGNMYGVGRDPGTSSHPLLPSQHVLVLKAVISEAAKRGIKKVVLSDGESAMMTEGHDKAGIRWTIYDRNGKKEGIAATEESAKNRTPEGGRYELDKLDQEGGMRLHYDTTLPSAMAKLIGDSGVTVELGTHKNANGGFAETDLDQSMGIRSPEKPVGSPVFKNPDGTPKSSVTGKEFDISKAVATSNQQGGFTLGDPARAPKELPDFVPTTDNDAVVKQSLTGDGHQLLGPLQNSNNIANRTIANTLIKNFPEALKLISGQVKEGNGSYATPFAGRRIKVTFDPSVVTASSWHRENLILHEVIHGLTIHELDNPSKPEVGAALGSLRQRLISSLPMSLKAYFDEAQANGWWDRNMQDDTGKVFYELAPTPRERQILYGLMDDRELVAQGFSSHDFKNYMKAVKGKTSGWRMFTDWVKDTLGLTKDELSGTAFSEFLGLTQQVMSRGEFLAGMQNFGERWFQEQGKSEPYAKAQTERALGLIAESGQGISKEELVSSLAMGEGRFNPRLEQARKNLDLAFQERGDDYIGIASVMDELGHDPSTRGLDDFVETAIAEGTNVADALDLLPPVASTYVFEKLRDHKDVLGVIEAATKDKNSGLVNIAEPGLIRGAIQQTLREVTNLLKEEKRQTDFAQSLVGLNAVEPSGFASGAPKEIEKFIEGVGSVTGGISSWLANFLEPMGQVARRIPEAAEIIAKGFQLAPNSRKMFNEAVKVFGVDVSSPFITPEPTYESVKESQRVFSTPKLLNAANRWIYWNQKEGGDSVQMLQDNHPEIAKLMKGLTTEERTMVHDLVAKQGKSTQTLNAQKLEKMTQIAAINGAGVVGADTRGKTKDNLALADTLLRAMVKMNDPLTAWQGQAEIQSVQTRMEPEAFLNILRFTQGEAEKLKNWKEYFDKNPFWATAQRTERYLVRYTKGKKRFLDQASSMTEARALIEKKGGTLVEIKDQWKGRDDEPFAFPNMTPEMAQRMQGIEENQIKMLVDRGVLGKDDVDEFRRTSAVTQILREATADQSIPGVTAPPRLLSQGAEELPWMWNHITNAQRESMYWSRQLLRAQARTYLRDPELASNEALRKQLSTHFDNMLHPDPMVAQKMRQFASTWFLGFNMATTVINAAQPFTTHVAELTSITGKPLDSYRRVLSALDEAWGHKFKNKEFSTPEVADFIKRATRDGEVGIGKYDDEAAAQESIATNYKRAMMKEKVQSLGQRLETAAGAYSTAGMWVFQHGERLNSLSALIAGFKLYRDMGLTVEAATQKAYEFNHAVNYGGGRAQRPVGAFSGRGAFPRTVAMLGTSLQSYVLGTTFQIARYLQKGFFRPAGLTPHEIHAARVAGIQMLGQQFLAAGLLGMPFASGAIALLDKLFPDLELNRKIRSGVSGFLSSDDSGGGVLGDIAMTGVPSLLGWDMQSRLSMGNTVPGVSEINGFQPEQLMGPVSNIVKNFVGGVTGWAKGDLSAGANFLPPAVGKLIDAGQQFLSPGGAIRDYQGRPLASPTLGEHLGRSLGFQPKRLSDQNAASRIATQATEADNRRESQFRAGLANEVLKGNYGTARSELLRRSQQDAGYDPVTSVRAISRAAEELTFPRDLKREGTARTAGVRNDLLRSFSNLDSAGGPSEVQRLQFRTMVQQRLGLMAQSSEEVRLAALMDQLKVAQPGATRSELRAAALAALRRSSPRTLGEPQE